MNYLNIIIISNQSYNLILQETGQKETRKKSHRDQKVRIKSKQLIKRGIKWKSAKVKVILSVSRIKKEKVPNI